MLDTDVAHYFYLYHGEHNHLEIQLLKMRYQEDCTRAFKPKNTPGERKDNQKSCHESGENQIGIYFRGSGRKIGFSE